jgi:putative transposase
VKKALTEPALNAEMDHHPAGANNTRNGYGRKTVMTDTGRLAIDAPRDQQARFLGSELHRQHPKLAKPQKLVHQI